ncbi:MAG: hypothetical protein MJ166_06255 [Clostridia bacterium]|nr:hypothetical protein [Clostridia bacterium]
MSSNQSALIKNPGQIREVAFSNYTLTLKTSVCTHSRGITGRTNKVTSVPGQMTIELSSAGANAIKVKYTNHKSSNKASKRFIEVKPTQAGAIDETEDAIIFKCNLFEARISKSDIFNIDFVYRDRLLTSSKSDNGGASYTTLSGVATNYQITNNVTTSEALTFAADELFYGLGSNGTSLILNGKNTVVDNHNSSGNKAFDFQNIPFYVSSKNYGVFINTYGKASLAFGTEYSAAVSFGVDEEELEYIIFAGEDMMNTIAQFNKFLGISHPAPSWSAGTALLFASDKSVTANDIINYVQATRDSGISISEIWLSDLWIDRNDPLGFSFDASRFPDPAAFCRKIHDYGISIGIGVSPYVSDNSIFYQECLENDLFIKSGSNVYLRDYECCAAAVLDLTNIAARSFLQARIDALLKLGIDMVEADFRYKMFTFADDEVTFFSGEKPSEVANYYATLFNEAVYDVVSRVKGHANAMVILNSASIGSQLYPYTNIIAETNDFSGISCSLRRALSIGLSGVTTTNFDTPLLAPGQNDTLFIRWAQFALLSPHGRITVSAKVPLSAYKHAVETIKLYANMRKSMLPHFYSVNYDAANLGVPAIRSLALEFTRDYATRSIDQQYMLGSQLMIAPITNNGNVITYYVPSGIWTNLLTRERIQGPCFKSSKVDINNVPILVRPNSIIVTTATDSSMNNGDILNNITFTVFELAENEIAATEVFSADGSRSAVINILKEGNKITVRTDGFGANKHIIFNGLKNVVSVSESIPSTSDFGTTIDFSGKELVITLG